MANTPEELTIDDFITVFLAALVVRGKSEIWVRTSRAHEERRRMQALHEFMSRAFEEQKNTEYKYFLVHLRNHLAPSPIGSFEGLRRSIFQKITTIVSVDLTYCHSYQIDLPAVTAKCYLEQADPWLRKLAEDAADAYMADVRIK